MSENSSLGEERNGWVNGRPWPIRTAQDQVAEFHRLGGVPIVAKPAVPPPDRKLLRETLLEEEFNEVEEAMREGDVEHVAKELADLVYVAYGAALEWGIDLDAVLAVVHESNMAKVRDGAGLRMRADGKVAKPEGWREPDVAGTLARQRSLARRYRDILVVNRHAATVESKS